ncbi:MAG: hypothetical protein CR982_05135 [Candidatus Cloacimonadota bacterium]|nr:MAG: hypothetical protein CR982_05135 [Candidatus Cloacimonadota bacterium]PIE78803.1 MAG: hypothetical protein CSA15_06020 [Candidatus Delongbacteria bacterium]
MQVIDILIYVLMFYFGLLGYSTGSVGRKFYFEKNFLSIVLAPIFVPIIRPIAIKYTGFIFASIISWALSYIIIMIITVLIYSRLTKLAKIPNSFFDKSIGLVLGLVKGFLMAGLITFSSGILFADKFINLNLDDKIKNSHTGIAFSKPINFYRFLIFSSNKIKIDKNAKYSSQKFYEMVKKEYNKKYKW